MVKIGEAYSMNDPENETITPCDRQTLVEVMDGAVVQDFGRYEEADKIEWSLQFRLRDWEIVKGYWSSRKLVEVTDQRGGRSITARIVIKSYNYVEHFRNKAITAKIELWRI